MKKIDLGQTISILANLGVIAGIAFLAMEISQNNEQLAAQTRFNYYQTRIAVNADMAQNPEMLEVIEKAVAGEELTVIEARRIELQGASILRRWEYEYGEFRRGLLTEEEYNVPQKRRNLRSLRNVLMPTWETMQFTPDFAAHFENEILAE